MNADRLIAEFGRLVNTPEAVTRLRRFVLDLASTGAIIGLRGSSAPSHGETDKPCLPDGWRSATLADVAEIILGTSPPGDTYNRQGEGVPLINGPVEFSPGPFGETTVNQYTTAPSAFCEAGDILLCVRGSTTGRTNIAAFRACIGRGVAAIRPRILSRFVHLMLLQQQERILGQGYGIAFPSINKQQIRGIPIPLPPPDQQRRIVERVAQLMELCDRLEAALRERDNLRTRLATASHERLTNPESPEQHAATVTRYLASLPHLYPQPQSIPALRRFILDLAVRGKLVVPTPDGAHIHNGHAAPACIAEHDDKSSSENVDNPPFRVAPGWRWESVSSIIQLCEYGTSVKSTDSTVGVPVIRMGEIQSGQIVLGNQKMVPRDIPDLPKLFLRNGDLLFNRTNSAELVGKAGIFEGPDDQFTFASYNIRLRIDESIADPRFVNLCFQSPYFRETQINPALSQQCGQANVNGTKLKAMRIPVPPLSAQQQIVERVGELMGLCDRLEGELSRSAAVNESAVTALISLATE